MHRDLAARNILVAGDKTCKVWFDESLAMVRELSCVCYITFCIFIDFQFCCQHIFIGSRRKVLQRFTADVWLQYTHVYYVFFSCCLSRHFLGCRLQISDFGMSRDLMDEDYYMSHGGQIPVKWTAPEVAMKKL